MNKPVNQKASPSKLRRSLAAMAIFSAMSLPMSSYATGIPTADFGSIIQAIIQIKNTVTTFADQNIQGVLGKAMGLIGVDTAALSKDEKMPLHIHRQQDATNFLTKIKSLFVYRSLGLGLR